MSTPPPAAATPRLEGLVVHWNARESMHRLLAAWPGEEDFPLIVVDNSRDLELEPHPGLKVLRPDRNLGFAGGINLALQYSSAPIVMLLNPDVRPLPGAVGELADALDRHRDWPGLAPRLSGDDGGPQYAWQLRPLPTAWGLLRQLFFLPGVHSHLGDKVAFANEPRRRSVAHVRLFCHDSSHFFGSGRYAGGRPESLDPP